MRTIFRPTDWPLAVKLLTAFLVIALVPLLVVGILSQNQARDGLLTEAKRNLANTARRTTTVIDDFLKARVTDMQQTATLDSVTRFMDKANNDRSSLGPTNIDQTSTYNILKSKANSLSSAGNYLAIASKSGQVEITSNTNPNEEGQPVAGEPGSLEKESYFLEAMKGNTFITDPKLVKFQEKDVAAVIYVASPIRDVRGVPSGVVVLRFSLESIWKIVNADYEAAGSGSYTMLIDDTDYLGIRIADSRTFQRPENLTNYLFSIVRTLPTANRGPWVNSGRFPEQFNYQKANNNGDILPNLKEVLDNPTYDTANPFFQTNIGGGENLNAQATYAPPISSKPKWRYIVIVPDATYAAAANNITTTLIFAIVAAVVVVILVALLLARLLTTPVRRIGQILGRIGIGDFEARVPIKGRDELGRLGESLNAMFDNTLSLIQSREEKEDLQGQITRLLEEISTVAEGDLTVQAEVTADITGAIADSFNLMIEELRKIIVNIQSATGQASTFFDQMVQNSLQIDMVSDLQTNRVMTVTRSVEDVNRSIQQVSEAAVLSAEVAQEARQNAHQGGLAVTKTIAGMNRIRGNVQETAKKIKRLGESSQQIGEIVKLIDDIADQTNMLALNAAIQAAMAGEQGKGFSVVSEEVRRLAERSATATKEIAGLVKSIQDDTAEAVVAMEESTREVVDGSKVADEAGRALASIEAVVERLATLITNISVVSRQQATSSTDIARSMVDLSQLTQEASALRHQSAQAVQSVARTADELRVSVSAFKVTSEANALESGRVDEALVLEALPVVSGANNDTAPDYYQYMPASERFDRHELYQSPAGDGGSPDFGDTYKLAEVPAQVHAGSEQAGADRLDFDLNTLLGDDTIFDTFFDNGLPPQTARKLTEDDKSRPPALG